MLTAQGAQEQFKSRTDSGAADIGARSGEDVPFDQSIPAGLREGHENKAHRLCFGTAARSGDAGDRNGDVRAARGEAAFSHRGGDDVADGAAVGNRIARNAERYDHASDSSSASITNAMTNVGLPWNGQFNVQKIEGKNRAFLPDLVFLLIGPAWLMSKIYAKIGQRD